MHSPIDIFAYKIYKKKLLPNKDIRKMKYAMQVIWGELYKFVILFALFAIVDRVYLFLFCLGLLLPIRTLSGGLHFKRGITCFIVSLSFFSLVIFILPSLINMTTNLAMLLMFISVLVIYRYAPIPSPFRPISNKKKKTDFEISVPFLYTIVYFYFISFYFCL
ncbi:MAG: accessory gene regulator B family protein [Clostridiaceae bacterium]|nr:accessory gene regulator B family protein [Clostridiaceae bacterium]